MARSKLYGMLRRSAQIALAAERQGWSTSEAAERLDLRLSRRRFLEASAGIAAGGMFAACGNGDGPIAPKPETRIAIIGGGMAGLHCAYRLQKAGARATLYEASNRVGGRMHSARGMFGNQVAELGGELIDTGHATMQGLAAELEIQLDDLTADEPANFARDTYWFNGGVISETNLIDLFRPIALRMADAVSAAEEETEAGAMEFERLDAMSISEWLDGEGQADPVMAEILKVTYTGEYGLEADEQSIFNLLYLVDYEEVDPFRIYGDSDERYHTHLGSDTFTTKLAERLGAQVQTDTLLEKVKKETDARYTLTFQKGGGIYEDSVTHVVFALPFTKLREVDLSEAGVPAEKQRIITELGYGTNAKIMGGFRGKPWLTDHNASGSSYSDLGIQTTWDTARGQGGADGILTNFLGGVAGLMCDQGTPESRMQGALPHLDTIWPGSAAAYQAGSAVRMHWPTAPFMKGSYACYRTGQWSFFGLEGARQDNLHFCGEHTSQDFQGYMEGAAESGAMVANEVLNDLGLASPALTAALGARWKARGLRLRRQKRRNYLRQIGR